MPVFFVLFCFCFFFAAFGSYFCLSKTFTFPQTLRHADPQTLAVNYYFFGPRIIIIAENKMRIPDFG